MSMHHYVCAFFLLAWGSFLRAECSGGGADPQLCETREIQFLRGDAASLKERAQALGSPARIYEYLRNNAQYSPYHGARSSSVNAFLSLRGNDVDLASALIAMLRSQGIRARYVQGDVIISKTALANWLGVVDQTLAVALLRDQGIQNVIATDPVTVSFQHVWVEALVDYGHYRGGQASASATCSGQGGTCQWVAIDPSFKQKRYQSTQRNLLRNVNFDFNAYYAAQGNPKIKNKSALEIYEEQALAYLRANHPDVTLNDIVDPGSVVTDDSGLLPASLPFVLAGTVTRYDSLDDHDAVEATSWMKYLRSTITWPGCSAVNGLLPRYRVALSELSTKQLTLTMFGSGTNLTFGHRLDGQAVGNAINISAGGSINVNCDDGVTRSLQSGIAVTVTLEVDAEPGRPSVKVDYANLVVGGYFLIASGGETSNRSQVTRAYEKLLRANQDFPVVIDGAGSLGTVGIAYVDKNANQIADPGDVALIGDLPAMDALTGGLLYVAQSVYYNRLREETERYGRLKGIVSPVSAYLGIISSVQEVEYLNDLPFAIMPGGLLIDLKGIRYNGSWETDQPAKYSNETFKFLGHIGSSLEHEVWQQITGYDAISTVRGIQFALEQGRTLLNITPANFVSSLPALNFPNAAPTGFSKKEYALFSRNLVAWTYSGTDRAAAFDVFRPNVAGLDPADPKTALATYRADNGLDRLLKEYDDLENLFTTEAAKEGKLKTAVSVIDSNTVYSKQSVLSAVASTAGFVVASHGKVAGTTNQWRYTFNETAQHAGSSVPVAVTVRLTDAGDTRIFEQLPAGLPTNYTVVSNGASIVSPTGGKFTLSGVSKQASNALKWTLGKAATVSAGVYTVKFKFTLLAGGRVYLFQPTATVEIFANRMVDATRSLSATIDVSDPNMTLSCDAVSYTAKPSVLLPKLKTCFNSATVGYKSFIEFFDRGQGFDPATYAYRSTKFSVNDYDTRFVMNVRDAMYFSTDGSSEYLMPSRLPQDTNYLFGVYLKNFYDPDNQLASSTYAIVNHSNRLLAGGGYVTATTAIDPANPVLGADFKNANFTDASTVSITNNDLIRTPSTSDPASTVTGNNYHDETDIAIKGRGINYGLTRTYNSAPSSSGRDGPFGFGWSHSYGMHLKSNDHGNCPNCTPGASTTAGQAPENGNAKTASITYVDERGGEHNYLVNESSLAVIPPQGEFDTLTANVPVAGQYTVSFRNGTKYVFSDPSHGPNSDLLRVPGKTARLVSIQDPYGNALNFGYDAPTTGGRLISISDNLAIPGRTGLALNYIPNSGHILSVTDWTGRSWQYGYAPAGNLRSVINPLQQRVTYGHHPNSHNLADVTMPLSRDGKPVKTSYTYYQNGRTYGDTNGLGQIETLDYDLFRKKTRVTDPRGKVREFSYDTNGALTKLIEPDGAVLQFTSSTDSLRASKVDGRGYRTEFSYRNDKTFGTASDTAGNITRERDALGKDLDRSYGVFDQIATEKDRRGITTAISYYTAAGPCAVLGKPKDETLSSLNGVLNVKRKSFCWNADGTLQSLTEYLDTAATRRRVTSYVYEEGSAGLNVSQVVISATGTSQTIRTHFTYDPTHLGRKLTQIFYRRRSASDPTLVALTTAYAYDDLDRLTLESDPIGNQIQTVYDANGKVAQIIGRYKRADGSFDSRTLSTRTYDAADRLISETDQLGQVKTYTYDAMGNVLTERNASGNTVHYEYDEMRRRTAVTDDNGRKTVTTYDLAGNALTVSNANGETVRTNYDPLGRPVAITNAQGYQTTMTYDANGNGASVTDANAKAPAGAPGKQPTNTSGATTTRIYDELNRVTSEIDANNKTTAYTYDLLGNRLTVTDALNHITTFAYDDLGRLIATKDPLVEAPVDKLTSYSYDEAGNVLTKTDRKGQVTTYAYDDLNRVTSVQYADGSVDAHGYDIYGNRTRLANADVTYTFVFDAKNRLSSKADVRGSTARSLRWTYDASDHIRTKSGYDNDKTTYVYDGTRRLVALQNPAYLQVSYHYDPAGRPLNRILSNGAQTDYTYDAGGFLIGLVNRTGAGSDNLVSSTTYTRDRLGNILTRTDATGTATYTYDPLYRLLSASYPTFSDNESYTYDAVGNRQTYTKNGVTLFYIYDANNRLVEIRSGAAVGALVTANVYDADGNQIKRCMGGVVSRTDSDCTGATITNYTWDARGRLLNVSGGIVAANSFRYDPLNYRISKNDSRGSRADYLEGEHLEASYNGALPTARYMRGVVVDEIVNAYLYDPAGKWTNVNFHHDALTNTVGLSGHDGKVLQSTRYSAFGNVLSESLHDTFSPNRLKYTGREEDPDTGVYYYRARYYDPSIGRFISEDPMGFEAGVNFYAYVGNNPLNESDPTGMVNMRNLGFGLVDFTASTAQAALGLGIMIGSPTTGPAIPAAFWGGTLIATSGAIGMGNSALAVRHSLYDTSGPGLLESVGGALFGNTGGTVGQGGDLFLSLRPAAVAAHASNFFGGVFDIFSGINSANGAFGRNPGASNWGPQLPTATVVPFGAASGGFVLYPNRINTNTIQPAYAK